jgi:hypothetical protein
MLVGGSYMIVGVMGYIGFTGYYFTEKFLEMKATDSKMEITQNCIMMFGTTNILAFFMRIALFCLLFCCFPLINHFLRSLMITLLFKDKELTDKAFRIITVSILIIPLLVTIFFPKVGSILGLIGSFAGLIIVYILPVITYLKKLKTECEHPVLAKAIEQNLYHMRTSGSTAPSSPRIVVDNAIVDQTTPSTRRRLTSNSKPLMK